MTEDWTSEQRKAFARDGFLIVEEGFIDGETVELLHERFDRVVLPGCLEPGRWSAWLDAELAQDLDGVLAEPGHGS